MSRRAWRGARLALVAWAAAILSVSAGAADDRQDLAKLSTADVATLQQRLTDAECYAGPVDGQPNDATKAAVAACPDQRPQLRIETVMHQARVRSLSVDRACHLAVTGSNDKTVRLWSLPDGRLMRTIRLPIGSGDSGKVDAVALSPDGRLIAAGGFDANEDFYHKGAISLLHVDGSGSMRRLGSLDLPVTGLAFSPDGSKLAVQANGVHVFDVGTGKELMADPGGQGLSLAFGPDGTLFATTYDSGLLRKYDRNLHKTGTVRVGGYPVSLALDASASRLAVGFERVQRIDLFDAATLRRKENVDVSGLRKDQDLAHVAWFDDGRLLAGGGSAVPSQAKPIAPVLRMFTADGKRTGYDIPVTFDTMSGMQPCGAGIVFVTGEPSFGSIDAKGAVSILDRSRIVDMRDKKNTFAVSDDAKQVAFGLGFGAERPVVFDLGAGTLDDAPIVAGGRHQAESQQLKARVFRGFFQFLVGGRIQQLVKLDVARVAAAQPDHSGLVVGSASGMQAYRMSGERLWRVRTPADTWGVNLSSDGRMVVAAYGDGTIRWHRWSDGGELLALFVEVPSKRWVAWTPSGYYMASPGGENLIGWHVNRGWNQTADFFPASRFRTRFNRPDIVRLVLDTLDEEGAVRQANAAAKRKEDARSLVAHLPPVLQIVEPASGVQTATDKVSVTYTVRSPSGQPVDRIDVIVDGRPVTEIGLPVHGLDVKSEPKRSIEVTLHHRTSDIGLIGWSGDLAGEPATVRVVWSGAPAETNQGRKLSALVVGVSDYADPNLMLHFAAKDARDFAKALGEQKGGYYGDVAIRLLTDRAVTRTSLVDGLDWLAKSSAGPDDVSVLFLSGHGLTDPKQTYWFFPSDATPEELHAKGVSQDEMRRSLQDLPGKVIWFLDTCHAGGAAKRAPVDTSVLMNTISSAENGGIVVFASSTGRQLSVERGEWNNGAFTKALIEGIELGRADLLRKGFVTTSTLDSFVENRVQELTGGAQNPVMERPPQEPDFTVAKVMTR